MPQENVHIIFNPASAGGKTGERKEMILTEIKKYFSSNYSLHITHKQHDAAELAKKALEEQCSLLIVVGGDGTIQEAVNGLIKFGDWQNCSLGIVSCGTGQGFAMSLGLPKSLSEQLRIIKEGHIRNIDVGKIIDTYNEVRYFINEFQAGIGGAVVKNVNGKIKRKGGKLAFGIGTICTIFQYPNPQMKLIIDDNLEINEEMTGVLVANGNVTGGGMQLAPSADLSDGFLDLLLMRKQNSLQRMMIFPKIYSGTHIYSPFYSYRRIKKIKLVAEKNIPLEADGELLNSFPLEISLIPSAISVCVNIN